MVRWPWCANWPADLARPAPGAGRWLARRPYSARDGLADQRGYLGAEQLDGPHDVVVRHRPDRQLGQEPLVAEDRVLSDDLVGHLLGRAHQQRALRFPRVFELFPGQA